MAGWRPGVEWPHARQNRKADKDQRETPHLKTHRQPRVRQRNQSRRVAARRRVGRKQPDQHHRRAYERIERQLHRRVLAPRRTPDGDQEVLRHDRDFVKHEQQKQIEAEKNSVDAADQRQEEREELIGAQFDVPAEQHARDRGQPRQQHQHAADAVRRQQEVNPHRRHPWHIDNRHHGTVPRSPAAKPSTASTSPATATASASQRDKRGVALGQQRLRPALRQTRDRSSRLTSKISSEPAGIRPWGSRVSTIS